MSTFTSAFGIICLISVLISAGGFLYFVYFFSVCYGFSIAGMSVAMMVLFWGGMDTWMKAICILLTVYGLRLGICADSLGNVQRCQKARIAAE